MAARQGHWTRNDALCLQAILETSIDTVKDGQIGALSLDDLTAIWVFDGESGKRENKLNTIKDIKRFMGKDEQISVEELNKKIKDGISLADISATFWYWRLSTLASVSGF